MVRVATLREQAFGDGAPQDYNPDGMKAINQLKAISRRTRELIDAQYKCLTNDVLPALASESIQIHKPEEVASNKNLRAFFDERVFPTITPMAIDPSHPRPRYHNRALYLGAILKRKKGFGPKQLLSVVQIPQVLPRLVPIGDFEEGRFVLLEDLVASHLPELFGGFTIEAHTTFRITRDSDLDLLEQESDDMLRLIEERLRARRRADAVRLEVNAGVREDLLQMIIGQEEIRHGSRRESAGYSEVYQIDGPIDLTVLMGLHDLPLRENLRDEPIVPATPSGLRRHGEDLFDAIRRRDILLHHPYEDFTPVVDFVRSAAEDPDVLAIKQTLYRTSGDSPIARALIEAADQGKHVTAIVELQARFDEEANVTWARQMERSGVHVVYGFMDLKTHSKVSMVVRQEEDAVRRYVHLSTGNYNPSTAMVYTDLGLFTSNEDVATDVSALFNLLTGYSQGHQWRKLIVAPENLHSRTLQLIEDQAQRAKKGKPSRIFAKLNSLVDHHVIEALYSASQAGVPIELVVRGICCLRPGIKGISDNIRVISIVDRFLEHSRVYVFGPDETAKVFLSSADWMPRNFFRRVEVMFPIESNPLRKRILRELIPAYLQDNMRARILNSDGTYSRRSRKKNEAPFRCQHALLPSVDQTSILDTLSNGSTGRKATTSKRKRIKSKK